MKSMLVTFLTTFIGGFVGIYVVKFFFFHGNSWGVSDTVYCLVLSYMAHILPIKTEIKKRIMTNKK